MVQLYYCCSIKQDVVGVLPMYHVTYDNLQHLQSLLQQQSGNMYMYIHYDVAGNQVAYQALCISCKPNRTLYYHVTNRAPYGILIFVVWYVCTNLFIESGF